MTIYCWAAPRRFQLPEPEPRLFQVTDDTQVLAHCYWQPDRHTRPTILALHGLEGSSSAHYMRGIADKAFTSASTHRPAATMLSASRGIMHDNGM